MNVKLYLKALFLKAGQRYSNSKMLTKSFVSLFLVFLLGATSVFAWFFEHQSAGIYANNLKFQSASSLRVNNDDFGSTDIEIPEFTLDEASSVDGRNIFFPLGESFTSATSNMYFREANVGDQITYDGDTEGWYVYKTIPLKGTGDSTPVYIKSYKVTVADAAGDTDTTNDVVNGVYQDQLIIRDSDSDGKPDTQDLPPDNCPIRLAFIDDSSNTPKVIDPSAQINDYADQSTGAVALINDDNYGKPLKLEATHADSFAKYYFGGDPLFTLPYGDTDVTLVVWLEGTLPNCDKYIGKKISVEVTIESNFSGMETIYFIDQTQPDNTGGASHWVTGDNTEVVCTYRDPYSTSGSYKTVVMKKSDSYASDYTWSAAIPKKAITDIAFYRICPANHSVDKQGTIWNAWHTNSNVNTWKRDSITETLETSRVKTDDDGNSYNAVTYTAIKGNGYGKVSDNDGKKTMKRLSPCVGFWDYSSGSVSPTESSTQAPTQAPSGKRQVEVNFATSQHTYVQNNYSYHGIYPYLVLSDGSEYKFDNPSVNAFKWSGQLDVGVQVSRVITKNSYTGATLETFSPSSGKAIVSGSGTQYVNCYINNDKTLIFS